MPYRNFMFDVSKEKDKLKTSVVDVQLKATFTENVSANTKAFALVISGKICHSSLIGTKCLICEIS